MRVIIDLRVFRCLQMISYSMIYSGSMAKFLMIGEEFLFRQPEGVSGSSPIKIQFSPLASPRSFSPPRPLPLNSRHRKVRRGARAKELISRSISRGSVRVALSSAGW